MEITLYKSDIIDVTDNLERMVEIRYTNDYDYAGVVYSGSNPPEFRLYVEALFFKERFPEDNEAEQIDQTVVKLRSVVKKQKKLEIEPVPYYLVHIIKLALTHNTVHINGERYVKEEEIAQRNMNDHFPFEVMEVWLTEPDSRDINLLK